MRHNLKNAPARHANVGLAVTLLLDGCDVTIQYFERLEFPDEVTVLRAFFLSSVFLLCLAISSPGKRSFQRRNGMMRLGREMTMKSLRKSDVGSVETS